MDNQDKTTFSLDDEEIVEEEVTERDEEYDDDYDDYDEGYDEEYDDEGDYEDEEYDDGYDDGYNDEYYDDRLNKVLDEIAELKRGMAPATIQPQQPIMPPQYIYQPTAPPAGSEVVMYNEISRLRDELAKNTSSLEMQKELTRMKEDMARDQKIAEAQHNAEIQRLQSKIDDLLKNGEGPQSETVDSERIGGTASSLDLDKLLSINEAILRATRDSDARIQGEIEKLKKHVEEMPSLKELNGAVAAVKKAAGNLEGVGGEALEKLAADIAALRSVVEDRPASAAQPVQSGSDADITASELLRQLYEIRNIIGNSSQDAVDRVKALCELANEYKKVRCVVHSQASYKDKLVAVYDYAKKVTDCGEQDAIDYLAAASALTKELSEQELTRSVFGDLAAYCAEHGITTVTTAVRDGAEKFFTLTEKISAAPVESYGDYLPDLLAAINTLEGNRCSEYNSSVVGNITTALLNEPRDDGAIADLMAELTAVRACDVVSLPTVEVPASYSPSDLADDETIFARLEEIKAAVLDSADKILAAVGETAEEKPVEREREVVNVSDDVDEGTLRQMLAAIDELKAKLDSATDAPDLSGAIDDIRNEYVQITDRLVDISEKLAAPAAADAPVMTEQEKQAAIDDLAYIRAKLDEQADFLVKIDELKEQLAAVSAASPSADVSEQLTTAVAELTAQFDKLYEDISGVIIETEANIVNKIGELGATDGIDAAKTEILAETQAIKDSLLTITDAVYALPLVDTLDAAKADILADTQIIKDSVTALNDTLLTTVADGVDQLRNDVAGYVEYATAGTEAAAADRARLLDDIAFLREQAEIALSESEEIPDGAAAAADTEKFISYLDEIAARVSLLATMAEDVVAARDNAIAANDSCAAMSANVTAVYDSVLAMNESVSAASENINGAVDSIAVISEGIAGLGENVTALGDNLTSINDNIALVNDNVAAVTESINGAVGAIDASSETIASINDNMAVVAETIRPLAEDVVTTRDNVDAVLNAIAPISDMLNSVLDRLEAEPYTEAAQPEAEDASDAQAQPEYMTDEDLVELKEALNTILDTLPLFPQADDVVAARDNTYAILDTLEQLPHNGDLDGIRDSIASVLDTVGVLTDNVNALAAAVDAANNAEQAGAAVTDELALIREVADATAEDVRAIRQKLDAEQTEEQADDISDILQDLGLVLDKIEEYERTAAANKQEIIDAVGGIREEFHINNLDETMSAAGIDDATRDAFVGEVTEIRERLSAIEDIAQNMTDANAATLDGVTAQLADLQAMIEGMGSAAQDEASQINAENLQALFDELAAIKERLEGDSEYDTVEEILSLREDVKAARIVDQNDVAAELEAVKNELASISSGNILDEIRALREDIGNIGSGDGANAATDGEINLVLNEIVSLRDEVFAFKDEVLNITAVEQAQEQPSPVDNGDDLATIMDELTALRADQSALTGSVDELKDVISRRTTVSVETEGGAVSGDELNVVLGEIINLKNDIERVGSVGDDKFANILEQVDEMRAVIDELKVGANGEQPVEDVAVDFTPIMEQFDGINAALDELKLNREIGLVGEGTDGEVPPTIADKFDVLSVQIDEIRSAIADITPPETDYSAELEQMRAEISALREENRALRERQDTSDIGEQLSELKQAIQALTLTSAPVVTEDGDTSYAALIEEIRSLKAAVATPAQATFDEDTVLAIRDALAEEGSHATLGEELGEIRDEIAQLRSLTTVSAEGGSLAEVAALRDELAEIKAMLGSEEHLTGVAEDVTAIKQDVQSLKDEPDLGVMSEILALRDEFQALREQIEDVKRIAGKTDSEADSSLLSEVQSLRDQLFAISMANVNDPESGETGYESYNNIILDELSSLHEQIDATGTASDMAAILDEFDKLKASIAERDEMYEAAISRINNAANTAADGKILSELAALRADMANQRDADLTTLNFMSEMAHLLERQNQYLTQNGGSRITDEIESLKAEIASSDSVAEEVAKLREVMTKSGGSADNESVLAELAELREELSREKPSRENALILDAIARLRDEITTLAEREQARNTPADADLSDSLSDLKDQLNEIAGIVEPERIITKPYPSASAATGGAKRGRKPGSKNKTSGGAAKKPATGGAKRGRKPKNAAVPADSVAEQPIDRVSPPISDIEAIIDEQERKLGGDGMSLNPAATTREEMDLAERLANQVANKLVMEQLVEQLADGGVSTDRVNEIVRDILPHEFTTIAETEASDKVRRLANRLVLDKLRARLRGKKPTDGE